MTKISSLRFVLSRGLALSALVLCAFTQQAMAQSTPDPNQTLGAPPPVTGDIQSAVPLPLPGAAPAPAAPQHSLTPAPVPATATAVPAPVPVAGASTDPSVDQLLKKIESDPSARPDASAAAAPPANGPAPVGNTPQPPAGALNSVPVVPLAAANPKDNGSMDVPVVPALPPAGKADENLFFDSNAVESPHSEMKSIAPHKVDPSQEPASKLIVVEKDYNADSAEAKMVAASRAMILGRYDAALEIYNEIYAKNKKDPAVLLGRAVAMQKGGQTDDAINAYKDLLEIQPKNMTAEINMLGLMSTEYPAVARQRLKELSDKHPDDIGLIAQMGIVDGNLGHYDDALKELGIAVSMDPNNASHLFNMAVICDRAGKKDDAIQLYQKALETDAIYGGSRSIPRDLAYARLAQLR